MSSIDHRLSVSRSRLSDVTNITVAASIPYLGPVVLPSQTPHDAQSLNCSQLLRVQSLPQPPIILVHQLMPLHEPQEIKPLYGSFDDISVVRHRTTVAPRWLRPSLQDRTRHVGQVGEARTVGEVWWYGGGVGDVLAVVLPEPQLLSTHRASSRSASGCARSVQARVAEDVAALGVHGRAANGGGVGGGSWEAPDIKLLAANRANRDWGGLGGRVVSSFEPLAYVGPQVGFGPLVLGLLVVAVWLHRELKFGWSRWGERMCEFEVVAESLKVGYCEENRVIQDDYRAAIYTVT